MLWFLLLFGADIPMKNSEDTPPATHTLQCTPVHMKITPPHAIIIDSHSRVYRFPSVCVRTFSLTPLMGQVPGSCRLLHFFLDCIGLLTNYCLQSPWEMPRAYSMLSMVISEVLILEQGQGVQK